MKWLKRSVRSPQKRSGSKKKWVMFTNPMVRRQLFIGVTITIVLALLLTATYKITRFQSLQIDTIEVVGGKTISHQTIETLAAQTLSGSYVRLVPYRFRLTYPRTALEDRLQSIDRVKKVSMEIVDKHILKIIYDEYIPIALWCGETMDEACFFIDETGYSFAEAPPLIGTVFVRFTQSDREPQKKTQAFDPVFITMIKAFIEQFETEVELFITHIALVGDYDLLVTVAGGGQLKLSQTMSLAESFQNIQTLFQSEEFSHLQSGNFVYIDLRFGDKVFVNEFGETSTSTVFTEGE